MPPGLRGLWLLEGLQATLSSLQGPPCSPGPPLFDHNAIVSWAASSLGDRRREAWPGALVL